MEKKEQSLCQRRELSLQGVRATVANDRAVPDLDDAAGREAEKFPGSLR